MPVVISSQKLIESPPLYEAMQTKQPSFPALQNGDLLTREEFEHRYEAMPLLKKAELIEGVVYMPSPVGDPHSWSHGQIMTWLGVYCAATPGLRMNDNATVRLDTDNEPQPDALVRIVAGKRCHSCVGEDGYIEGAPELVAEVAHSSASYDRHIKLHVYRRNGVQEYIVWNLYDNQVEWFQLIEGRYIAHLPEDDGIIRSRVLPGLWLAVEALTAGNLAEVLRVVQEGIQTAEHATFVQQLQEE